MNGYDRIYSMVVDEGKIATGAGQVVTGGINLATNLAKKVLTKANAGKVYRFGRGAARVVSKGFRRAGEALHQPDSSTSDNAVGSALHKAGSILPAVSRRVKRALAATKKAAGRPLSDSGKGNQGRLTGREEFDQAQSDFAARKKSNGDGK